jgi:hypothetical protein
MISKDNPIPTTFFRLIRILVSMILEIGLLKLAIGRPFGTMPIQLQRIGSLAIIIPLVTSMSLRLRRPLNHLIPITAHAYLPVAKMVRGGCGHRCVVCHAHEVLSQAVQAVVDVVKIKGLVAIGVFRDDGFANQFLCVDVS